MWILDSTAPPLLVATTAACALLLALTIDRWWGELPARLHPVVWMGWYLGLLGRTLAPQVLAADDANDVNGKHMSADLLQNWMQFALGALAWLVGAAAVFGFAMFLQNQIIGLISRQTIPHLLVASFGLALLFKPLFAMNMLCAEVRAVEAALQQSLPAGRERLSMLVSRDTACLSESQVRESAIESLAENLNDSVIAPIFWFVLLGLPGAAVYRFANTADAKWGYKGIYNGQNWEWAGKWAARADDVLSWLPARITAVLLWRVSGPKTHSFNRSFWSALRQEAIRTPSPNSGWPMAAMALLLNIQLSKPGVYVLHPSGHAAQSADVSKAIDLSSKSVLAGVLIVCLAIYLIVFGWTA
ncbi:MAG: adenosylcobinamide-phosphate synthase CbiB [Burkholderiaceae bacterium]|nr:adenosylcobinamide-phosphate synthase CbiB [Burkholderiaceae bacterium]